MGFDAMWASTNDLRNALPCALTLATGICGDRGAHRRVMFRRASSPG